VTEISAAKKLLEFRAQMRRFVGPSFETISSVGESVLCTCSFQKQYEIKQLSFAIVNLYIVVVLLIKIMPLVTLHFSSPKIRKNVLNNAFHIN
jgi:hypothetical protein